MDAAASYPIERDKRLPPIIYNGKVRWKKAFVERALSPLKPMFLLMIRVTRGKMNDFFKKSARWIALLMVVSMLVTSYVLFF